MEAIVLLGLVTAGYALSAIRLRRFSISGPLVFLVAGVVLGRAATGVIVLPLDGQLVQVITEMTLVLLLFTDASRLRVSMLLHSGGTPVRLLAVGLPLCMVAGAFVGHAVLAGVTWGTAGLVAVMLAPTDAALSLPVMNSPRVPERIRTALNVESGLNDGIATPFVTLFVAIVAAEAHPGEGWLGESVRGILIALLTACLVGGLGAALGMWARSREWSSPRSSSLLVVTLAVLSYAAADLAGGNGFVSAFLAGLVFAMVSRGALQPATLFTETLGVFGSYAVWALFGALLVGPLLTRSPNLSALAFAALVLTAARILPVLVSLLGNVHLDLREKLFIGWFGPRGLASVVFLMHTMHALHLDSTSLDQLAVQAVVWTIFLSVVAHGLSAGPSISLLRAGREDPAFPQERT